MKKALALLLAALMLLGTLAACGDKPATESGETTVATDPVIADAVVEVATLDEFKAAFSTLAETGGTVRLTADIETTKSLELPAHTGAIRLDGAGHKLTMINNVDLGGDMIFENIDLCSGNTGRYIRCNGHSVHITDTVTCSATNGGSYPSIAAGGSGTMENGRLTVDGGTWYRLRGGNTGSSDAVQSATVTINGGTYTGLVLLGASGPMSEGSKIDMTVNDGVFEMGLSCFDPSGYVVNADCTLTINGGKFYQMLRVANEDLYTGKLLGKLTLNLNGGDFADSLGIRTLDTDTMKVDIRISRSAMENGLGTQAATDEMQGTLLCMETADPWLFEHNGWYYIVYTGSKTVRMRKSRTISGLAQVDPDDKDAYIIAYTFDAELCADLGISKCAGTWSPEIHYYSEEDFPGNSGWYMNLALNTGENTTGGGVDVRMVVLKSLSDSPEGPYGNPITGVINDPELVVYDEDGDGVGQKYTEWSLGQTVMRVPGAEYGGIYALWVEEVGRGTANFYQKIMTAKMLNPWTFTGKIGIVTTPTQTWEYFGSAYNASTGEAYPKVVEGATPVYGENGELFLTYSGSGYWTKYGIGQLTWNGGDPTETSSWVKYAKNPIFSANNAYGSHYPGVNLQGIGHASFFTDSLGNGYICYHAYPYNASGTKQVIDGNELLPGKKAEYRNSYVETYTVDYTLSNGYSMGVVRVGNGTGRPKDNGTEIQTFALDNSPRNPVDLLIGAYKDYTVVD